MWGKSKQSTEHLPWYRGKDYKGNLTETEKRQLDALRMQDKHPSTSHSDLPEEVRSYIGLLEMQLYDSKQDKAAGKAFGLSAFGIALLYVNHFGVPASGSLFSYAMGLFFVIAPWLFYKREWRKNADEFIPRDPRAPTSTDEMIRQEWETAYITEHLRRSKSADD
jgi:hypothetical protein